MSKYFEMLRQQAAKAAAARIDTPSAALGIGGGERLAPAALRLPQKPQPTTPKARINTLKNHDQYENLKLYKPVTAADFIYQGGGLR